MADTIGSYFPQLFQLAPGAPEMVVGDAVLRAMQEVARESRALRMRLTTPYVQDQPNYSFTSDGFRVMDFAKVWYVEDNTVTTISDNDMVPLEKKSRSQISLLVDEDGTSNSRPEYWMNSAGQELSIWPWSISPAPTNAAIRVLAIVFPTKPAAQTYVIDPDTAHWAAAPDNFFWDNEEAIFASAASTLLLMPGKPWYNGPLGSSYAQVAEAKIARLRSLADDDGQPNVHRAVRYGGY